MKEKVAKNKKAIIAGNWKMNKTNKEALQFIATFIQGVKNLQSEVILFIPYVSLKDSVDLSKRTNVKIGAQNFHFESFGSYTGEISAEMLKDVGVNWSLVGHSERRLYCGETNEDINKKIKKAVSLNMKIILCVGEFLEQRESNKEKEAVMLQLKSALDGINKENLDNISIAYEPIWAIGTGKIASPDQVNKMCEFIRMCINSVYDAEVGINLKVLYGGSVNSKNCKDILTMKDIDGVLVGGASLKTYDFLCIAKEADKIFVGGKI